MRLERFHPTLLVGLLWVSITTSLFATTAFPLTSAFCRRSFSIELWEGNVMLLCRITFSLPASGAPHFVIFPLGLLLDGLTAVAVGMIGFFAVVRSHSISLRKVPRVPVDS